MKNLSCESKELMTFRISSNDKLFLQELSKELRCSMSSALRLCILIGKRELQDEFTGELKVLKNL